MQGNANQQAYDRGITIFSPDGRLYQVEYAREAVERGTAVVGVRTPQGVVLAADKLLRSPLIEPDSVEKLHAVDDHVGVASAGHAADARRLVDLARRTAQGNRLRYDEPIGVETLTKDLSDHVQEFTQTGGARPFGVALLVAGIEDGEPRLFEMDPSGTPSEWQATAIGGDGDEIRAFLADEYRTDLDLEGGVDLALRALAEPKTEGFSPDGVGVATVDVETESFRTLDVDETRERLVALDLLDDEPAS
jgi:proteasome alpha subunit